MTTGTILFRSTDDLNYTELGFVENSAVTGFTSSKLGDWFGGNVFDEINSVNVALSGTNTLTSATEAAVLADETLNAVVIGKPGSYELLQYKTATLLSANKYRLSGLLRGRRGTEWAMGLHTGADKFVLLGSGGTVRPNEGASAIGAKRYYKAVSLGRSMAQTYAQPSINTAVGLKPFSPVNMTWGVNAGGDLLISAHRRSRLQARQGIFWDLPLGEASELYDLEIYADSGYTMLKRTLSNQPGFPITYAASEQTADFGAAVNTTIYLKLYQRSAVVGRGYPLAYALDNTPFRGQWNLNDAYNVGLLTLKNYQSTVIHAGPASTVAVIRSSQSASAGKRYFELVIDALGTGAAQIGVGLSNLARTMTNSPDTSIPAGAHIFTSFNAGDICRDGSLQGATGFTTGAVIGFAIDFDLGKVWERINGTWIFNYGDPTTATPIYTFPANTILYPYAAFYNGLNQQVSLRLVASSQTGAMPAGYSAFIL